MKFYPILLRAANSFPVQPEPDSYIIAENPVERSFYGLLKEKFPQKLFLNRKVNFNTFSYFPDISFIDINLKIYIDIEIDEPYSRSGELTHYIESVRDSTRDNMFQQNGWHILRFSEKQILYHPSACVSILDLFIGQIIRNESILLPSNYSFLKHSGWTKDESSFLKEHSIRDYYNYEVSIINQEEIKVLLRFASIDEMFEYIILKNFKDFNVEKDIVFLPFHISEEYKKREDNTSLIIIDCLPSQGEVTINGRKYDTCSFSNYAKVNIMKTTNLLQYQSIFLKKKNNERIFAEYDIYGFHSYYNFAMYGTMNDYFSGNLSFIENPISKEKYQNEE